MGGCSSDCPQLFSFGCFRKSRPTFGLVARSSESPARITGSSLRRDRGLRRSQIGRGQNHAHNGQHCSHPAQQPEQHRSLRSCLQSGNPPHSKSAVIILSSPSKHLRLVRGREDIEPRQLDHIDALRLRLHSKLPLIAKIKGEVLHRIRVLELRTDAERPVQRRGAQPRTGRTTSVWAGSSSAVFA